MGDYIKELTIIDFLGILVPGSFLLLLFSLDYPVWDIWRFYFEEGSVADTVIFLIAGYLIGMLLHELGDLFEKLIWVCPWFNPRYHAAKTVFVATGLTLPFQFSARNTMATGTTKQSVPPFRQYVLPGIGSSVLLASVFIFPLFFRSGSSKWICACILIGAVALLLTRCHIKAKQSNDYEKAMEYVAQNAYIQTVIYGKASAPKQQMFDGFYCMTRNLLLVMGIANAYALFCPESPRFSQVVANVYGNPSLLSLYFSIVLLALLRCCHYAYLKYKYAYEDYLYVLSAQAQAENAETP